MLNDKLLTFADGKAITGTANSEVVDLGTDGGDEAARRLNLAVQLEGKAISPPDTTVAVALQQSVNNGSVWNTVVTFPAVSAADAMKGKRLVNFAKLPLGALKGQLRLALTVTGTALSGAKYSAYLTDSADSALG